MFSDAKITKVDENDLNKYLKIYMRLIFKNIEIKIRENTLFIFVEEEPLIQNVIFNGLKASKFIDPLKKL